MMPEDTQQYICVLCNTEQNSKLALQEHFRKHANKEIDCKGRPLKCYEPLSQTKVQPPSQPQSQVQVKRQSSNEADVPHTAKRICLSQVPEHCDTEPITCDVCNAEFDTVAKAINHKWKQHPDQPSKFCCSFCGKLFPLRTVHDKHVANEHTDSVPKNKLQCAECGETFFNENAREYHAKVTHQRVKSVLRPMVAPPPSKKIRVNNAGEAQSVYYCHLCGQEYIVKFNLRKHLEQRHSGEMEKLGPETEVIKCTICEALFYNKRAYYVHNMYHQPDDMYVTSEEHRLQIVTRVDQDFDIRRVHVSLPKTVRGFARQNMKMKAIALGWNPLASQEGTRAIAETGATNGNGNNSEKIEAQDLNGTPSNVDSKCFPQNLKKVA